MFFNRASDDDSLRWVISDVVAQSKTETTVTKNEESVEKCGRAMEFTAVFTQEQIHYLH